MRKEVDDYINELNKKQKDKAKEIEYVQNAQRLFPDVRLDVNRWGQKKLCSASVNPIATDMLLNHNCGCCPDSPLQFSAYIKKDDMKIYGDPVEIFIGQANEFGYGDLPDKEWEKRLEKYNFPESMIKRIQDYFNANKPENLEYDD